MIELFFYAVYFIIFLSLYIYISFKPFINKKEINSDDTSALKLFTLQFSIALLKIYCLINIKCFIY